MKALRLAGLELRRFRGPALRRLVPVVLVLIPLLYGGLYLWSNWDPYGRLDRVPVAVVNEDQPVDSQGQHIDAGNQFVQQLKAADIFAWRFVDRAEAREGLEQGRYYFTLEVPADFSAKLATATEPDPQRAGLTITKNDANGYIAGVMADTAKSELQNQINAATHAAYAKAIYGEVDDIREKLELTAEGTRQLVDGTALAEQGTAGLTTGLSGVRAGTGQISAGARTVADATAQLDAAATEATNQVANRLPEAVNGLVNGSAVVSGGLGTIKAGTGLVAEHAGSAASALDALGGAHPDLRDDPLYRHAADAAHKVAAATGRVDGDAQRALDTANDAHQHALALQRNTGMLQERIRAISTPVTTLRTGATQVATGTDGVGGGLDTLVSSSQVLNTGAGQLSGGAHRLDGLVNDALHRIPPTNPAQVARAADVLGSPTDLHVGNLNPAGVYGRGLAPFFFSIALWVFGLFAYLLLRPINQRALAGSTNAVTIAIAGWLPAAALGVLGGLVLFGVVDLGLGLHPVHLWSTLGLLALAAGAFVAIDQFLRATLAAVGDVLSLVLLIVQLTACGGLYPLQTTPEPFQAIHPLLPMSYLVDALRVTISGGDTAHLLRDVAVLAGFLVAFLSLTALAVWRQRTWSIARLHPQIEL
ncbi:YhgE/Pip family protein [Amycolatopsis anabasis]|uniref:YhgE/Pip family protein n=1 Tax=Amycolatopsis anabasis TaxID=1840409 RepID=UPI00131E0706|nr:YhgE/Pip domain-containing protein [Amycolatopsis anabasis]